MFWLHDHRGHYPLAWQDYKGNSLDKAGPSAYNVITRRNYTVSTMDKFSRIIKSKIVRIGNSQGVRIPHFLLQQLHLANEVEMSIQDDQLVIRAARKPRQDWEAQFSRLLPAVSHPPGEEALPQLTDWDGTEWTW